MQLYHLRDKRETEFSFSLLTAQEPEALRDSLTYPKSRSWLVLKSRPECQPRPLTSHPKCSLLCHAAFQCSRPGSQRKEATR